MPSRRYALAGLLGLGSLGTLFAGPGKARDAQSHVENAGNTAAPIPQPSDATPAGFIGRAMELRETALETGDRAYGAVVVKDGQIVGEAWSRVLSTGDPTAHAELEAIRDAARRLGTSDLSGCHLYASSQPCAMCEAGAYWARIDGVTHGPNGLEAGPPRLCG